MQIESIIRRKDGTVVDFKPGLYHFKPQEEDGPHIADVEDVEHISRLLLITEGYREYDPQLAIESVSLTGQLQPAQEDDEDADQQPAPVAPEEPAAAPSADPQPATESEAPQSGGTADAERDQLAAQYKARFGKMPHWKWSAGRIRDELADD